MEHFSHKHPLVLSKYNNSSADALCCGCNDPVLINNYVYHCIHQSTTISQDSPCDHFLLHKTCADLPTIIEHHLHMQHLLYLTSFHYLTWDDESQRCTICDCLISGQRFFYQCYTDECDFLVCCKCTSMERQLNHPSHNHTLALLPLKTILPICTACGTEGIEDFSYLCKTCFFWIHESCASAPLELICRHHHNDHPLVLAYLLPREYREFGVPCYLCRERYNPSYWLYYCAECRYFAHVQCALSAVEFEKENDIDQEDVEEEEEDVEESNLVHLPVSENEPHLLYQLIQQFTNKYSISTDEKSGKADRISQCHNGHSLILFDDFVNNNAVKTKTSDKRICDGCVQPLLSLSDPFYGCPDCNFFLHSICAADLPIEIQHAPNPEEEKEVTTLTRYYQASKPFNFPKCTICHRYCNGTVYSDDSFQYWVDIVCAALPNKIKHDSHRHTLQLSNTPFEVCAGCGCEGLIGKYYSWSYLCKFCEYSIHIGCALKPRKIKHRWDEHHLILSYPPIKGHPHDFNCEVCYEDINPNNWFYHCAKCDTSLHTFCVDQHEDSNIKYGRIFKYDDLHEHGLILTRARQNFKCNVCSIYYQHQLGQAWFKFQETYLKCISCKFSVCKDCVTKFV